MYIVCFVNACCYNTQLWEYVILQSGTNETTSVKKSCHLSLYNLRYSYEIVPEIFVSPFQKQFVSYLLLTKNLCQHGNFVLNIFCLSAKVIENIKIVDCLCRNLIMLFLPINVCLLIVKSTCQVYTNYFIYTVLRLLNVRGKSNSLYIYFLRFQYKKLQTSIKIEQYNEPSFIVHHPNSTIINILPF